MHASELEALEKSRQFFGARFHSLLRLQEKNSSACTSKLNEFLINPSFEVAAKSP